MQMGVRGPLQQVQKWLHAQATKLHLKAPCQERLHKEPQR
jgi:hypothetical protein